MTLTATTREIPAPELRVGYTLIQRRQEREVTRLEPTASGGVRVWLDGEKQSRRSYTRDDLVTVKLTDDQF